MIIRKLFKFEGAHIVRDCSSRRCKANIHGHSYIVEVFLTSDKIDNGGMIVDFGLLKTTIKDFIDSFDHAYSLWSKETDEFKSFSKKYSERWVEMPVTPSAEMYSLLMFYVIRELINNTIFNNGEGHVELQSVRVHETATGYAESFEGDMKHIDGWDLDDIIFSDQVKNEWSNPNMIDDIKAGVRFINPTVDLQFTK